jgi:hypothetical protein
MDGHRRHSILEGLSDEDRQNVPLLLERIYWALGNELDTFATGIKGFLGQHDQRLKGLEEMMDQVERCPCQGSRDPDWKCPLLELALEMGKVKRRLAWLNGGVALLALMLSPLIYLLLSHWR